MADKYLDCCLELGDIIRPLIQTGHTGKKYLYFRITKKKNGPDQYGKTHNLSVRQRDNSGVFQTYFIGSAIEKEFPNQPQGYGQGQPQAPQGQYNQPQGYAQQPPQGGYAPQAPTQPQYQQVPPQGYAPQAPAQPQYAPQAPAPAPAPTFADAPQGQPDGDLPF